MELKIDKKIKETTLNNGTVEYLPFVLINDDRFSIWCNPNGTAGTLMQNPNGIGLEWKCATIGLAKSMLDKKIEDHIAYLKQEEGKKVKSERIISF